MLTDSTKKKVLPKKKEVFDPAKVKNKKFQQLREQVLNILKIIVDLSKKQAASEFTINPYTENLAISAKRDVHLAPLLTTEQEDAALELAAEEIFVHGALKVTLQQIVMLKLKPRNLPLDIESTSDPRLYIWMMFVEVLTNTHLRDDALFRIVYPLLDTLSTLPNGKEILEHALSRMVRCCNARVVEILIKEYNVDCRIPAKKMYAYRNGKFYSCNRTLIYELLMRERRESRFRSNPILHSLDRKKHIHDTLRVLLDKGIDIDACLEPDLESVKVTDDKQTSESPVLAVITEGSSRELKKMAVAKEVPAHALAIPQAERRRVASDSAPKQKVLFTDVDSFSVDSFSFELEMGLTSFMLTCLFGDEESAQLFKEAGANINAQSVDGHTPLMFAARQEHEKIVELLLNAEIVSGKAKQETANPFTRDRNGKTALHWALMEDSPGRKLNTNILDQLNQAILRQFSSDHLQMYDYQPDDIIALQKLTTSAGAVKHLSKIARYLADSNANQARAHALVAEWILKSAERRIPPEQLVKYIYEHRPKPPISIAPALRVRKSDVSELLLDTDKGASKEIKETKKEVAATLTKDEASQDKIITKGSVKIKAEAKEEKTQSLWADLSERFPTKFLNDPRLQKHFEALDKLQMRKIDIQTSEEVLVVVKLAIQGNMGMPLRIMCSSGNKANSLIGNEKAFKHFGDNVFHYRAFSNPFRVSNGGNMAISYLISIERCLRMWPLLRRDLLTGLETSLTHADQKALTYEAKKANEDIRFMREHHYYLDRGIDLVLIALQELVCIQRLRVNAVDHDLEDETIDIAEAMALIEIAIGFKILKVEGKEAEYTHPRQIRQMAAARFEQILPFIPLKLMQDLAEYNVLDKLRRCDFFQLFCKAADMRHGQVTDPLVLASLVSQEPEGASARRTSPPLPKMATSYSSALNALLPTGALKAASEEDKLETKKSEAQQKVIPTKPASEPSKSPDVPEPQFSAAVAAIPVKPPFGF